MFTHGTADPFGSIDELRPAAALIPAATEIVEITGARHDLGSKALDVPVLAVDAALRDVFASGEVQRIYDKWFLRPIPPRNVVLNFPMGDQLKRVLAKPSDSGDPQDYK